MLSTWASPQAGKDMLKYALWYCLNKHIILFDSLPFLCWQKHPWQGLPCSGSFFVKMLFVVSWRGGSQSTRVQSLSPILMYTAGWKPIYIPFSVSRWEEERPQGQLCVYKLKVNSTSGETTKTKPLGGTEDNFFPWVVLHSPLRNLRQRARPTDGGALLPLVA